MKVYAICSDGSCAEFAWLDGLETVTAIPELEETPADYQRKLCHDVDYTIGIVSEIDREAERRAFEIADAFMAAARILASRASISVKESLYYIESLICAAQGSEECLYKLSDEAIAVDDYISAHRAESMEPRPVIVIFPTVEARRFRTLRDLYGQGVDTGPLAARPGLIRPADDGPWRAETGIHKEDCAMKRLTTDHPQDNTETTLNLFYVKDGEAWARNGGEEPGCPDVRLFDFARRLIREHGVEEFIEPDSDDLELGEQITEALFDGPDTTEGLVALLYTTAWAFAELREKLKQYEDEEEAGKLVHLPCKLGTPVYRIHRVFGECSMSSEAFKLSTLDELGSRVFLTVSEAAEALDALGKQS